MQFQIITRIFKLLTQQKLLVQPPLRGGGGGGGIQLIGTLEGRVLFLVTTSISPHMRNCMPSPSFGSQEDYSSSPNLGLDWVRGIRQK